MRESGQALLIVVLTMIVALTVGLSVVSRTITTIKTSTAEDESSRAFAAAEAGIEEALKSGVSIGSNLSPQTLPNNAKYFSTITASGVSTEYVVPSPILKDDVIQIWLSNYPDFSGKYSGTLTLHWGDPGGSCNDVPALEVIIFSGADITNPSLTRYALDPCSRGNNFTLASGGGGTVGGVSFRNSYTLPAITNGIIARIVSRYKTAKIAAVGTTPLPSQGQEVTSTGIVSSGEQEIVRKVRVFRSFPSLPGLFDWALFSGTNL